MLSPRLLAALALGCLRVAAQAPCANVPAYSPCELVFDLTEQEAAAHPNPYLTVQLSAEFRSPRHRTFLMPAFWDGGRRLIIRFTPTEPGAWDYRLSSNLPGQEGKTGNFTAAESEAPGFVVPRNVHHWAYTERNLPHLWMGDTVLAFATLDDALFRQIVDARATQKFNHIRGLLIGSAADSAKAYPSADRPDPAFFQRLDERIRYMNGKGIVADLILAADSNHLTRLFPTWQQREAYIRYVVSRYSPFNVTWQGVENFESYDAGRDLLKEIGALIKQLDPFQHPRSSGTSGTSSALLDDGWMDYVAEGWPAGDAAAIEHQLFPNPLVAVKFAYEGEVDANTFRRKLWNATMDGEYPTFGNTGVSLGQADAKYLDSPGARAMSVWYEFFSDTRHWELEPYFDVDGGRCVALEGIEYVVYVEKPGPIELLVEKHGYDVAWFNPASGESVKMKNFKGERFTGEPPDSSHDWVLLVSREGRKEGMLRSYKFESRDIAMQEIEANPQKVPYEIQQPKGEISMGKPTPFAAHIKRETRATRSMMYLWTGEAPSNAQGYRIVGTGEKGTLAIPPNIAREYPAAFNVRLYGMNANGKVYTLYQSFTLNR